MWEAHLVGLGHILVHHVQHPQRVVAQHTRVHLQHTAHDGVRIHFTELGEENLAVLRPVAV